uniref:Myosin motor domain-containing protein n=1 Tax=Glossina pallidipes TaxID=7398 RepID=A0A1B0A8D2_GLOPL
MPKKKKSKSPVTSFSTLLEDTSAVEQTAEEFDKNFDKCPKVQRVPWKEIQDYLDFKAARTIQRFARGWLTRNHLRKQIRAAIIIQSQWRRFYAQRLYFIKCENLLQQRIDEHYFRAAQKIQALFRGWWSREYIHDHKHLTRLENTAGMDLLRCVAFKLHHLIRTHVIPGIYSLKNTTTLSKVEELLSSISFKDCADRAREGHRVKALRTREGVTRHKESAFATLLPFYGPNVYNLCVPECTHYYKERDADRKMAKILRMYEIANRLDPKVTKLRAKNSKVITKGYPKSTTTFCDDIVRCMRKWRLLKKKKLTIFKDVLDDPKSIENFLKEVDSKWNILRSRNQIKDEIDKEMEKVKKTNDYCCPRTLN